MSDKHVTVYMRPFGYCDKGIGHEGEHPLYEDSDNYCKNFVSSKRLLEIKELFDLAEENKVLKEELEDFYKASPNFVPTIEFDDWEFGKDINGTKHWYSTKNGKLPPGSYFHIEQAQSGTFYILSRVTHFDESVFNTFDDAVKYAKENNN